MQIHNRILNIRFTGLLFTSSLEKHFQQDSSLNTHVNQDFFILLSSNKKENKYDSVYSN